MALKNIGFAILYMGIHLASCTNTNKINSEATSKDTATDSKIRNMKSYISIFEIPATDIERAINFYQSILEIKID